MGFRTTPKIFLVSGSLSWVAFSLLHLYSVSLDLDFIKASYTSLYLLFLGVFVISFYKYYDLLFSEVSRKNIFSTFFTLFINSIKLAVPVFLFSVHFLCVSFALRLCGFDNRLLRGKWCR